MKDTVKNSTPFFKVSDFIDQYGTKVNLKEINRAIFCFDPSLPRRIADKYKFKKKFAMGACLDVCEEFKTVLVSQFGFGAPASLLQLEYMKAFGITEFCTLGTACSLSSKLKMADGVFIEKAYGRTSYAAGDVSSSPFVENAHLKEGKEWADHLNLSPTTSWTSDAPYQETELDKYLSQDVSCLEMEASALMGAAHSDSVKMFCFAFISDVLENGKWNLSFSNHELKEKSVSTLEKLLQEI